MSTHNVYVNFRHVSVKSLWPITISWISLWSSEEIIQNGKWQMGSREAWASCQIRKIAGCACAGNAGNVMYHGTCVMHVEIANRWWWENVPGTPGACATRNFTYLTRCPWRDLKGNYRSSWSWNSPGRNQSLELKITGLCVRKYTSCSFYCIPAALYPWQMTWAVQGILHTKVLRLTLFFCSMP